MRKIRLNKEIEIDEELIKFVLEQHKEEAKRIKTLQRYYNNSNDIKDRSYNNGNKPKNKLPNPYASYITDTATGYFIGKPITYNNLAEYEQIDMAFKFNDESDVNMSIAMNSSICGYGIEIMYTDEEANVRFASVDPSECVIVYDNTLQENILFAIRYFDEMVVGEDKPITKVEVYTKESISFYIKEEDDVKSTGEEIQHYFLDVPISVYENNNSRYGDFEKVKDLIDAYDKTQSDSANDFEMFTHAYLVISGYLLDKEDAENIENQNIINFQNGDGKAEYLVKAIQDAALENYKNRIDNDIHKFSKVPNLSDSNFGNNSSGVSLSYKLIGLENVAGIKESKFKKGLMRRIELMCNVLKAKTNQDMVFTDIQPIFTRNKPFNEVEEADTMQKLSGILSEETLLAKCSKVDDIQAEMKRKINERNSMMTEEYTDLGEANAEVE